MTASIVVPAHNEERAIGRLLSALLSDAYPDELDVVIVANGCKDETAEVARQFSGVRVIETPVASKNNALRLGNEAVSGFPRLYIDADVVVTTADVRALVHDLTVPGVFAGAPTRQLPMAGVSRMVRWYYEVWQRLPGVADELYGRGVVGVSAAGYERMKDLPDVMSDDLAMATAFDRSEYVIVQAAESVIYPPRRYSDLVRRRVRAMTGNRQLDTAKGVQRRSAPRTSASDVGRLVARRPTMVVKAALFFVTALLAKVGARRALRRGNTEWLRDESSRSRQ